MKLQALQKLKFHKLKRRLGLTQWQTVGLLESIWLFTQGNAIAGDIGRHTDEDIAAAIEWEGDATEMIQTLIETGWIDRCPVNRLLVHDWEDHAPTYLKGAMSKNGKSFAKHDAKHSAKQDRKQSAKHTAKHGADPGSAGRLGCTVLTKPNLTIPNQTKPSSTSRASESFDRFWSVYPRKVAKAKAARAWKTLKPDEPLIETILSALAIQSKSEQWRREGGQFIPHPATWLNGRRWEDQITADANGQQAKPRPLTPFEMTHGRYNPQTGFEKDESGQIICDRLCKDPSCEHCQPRRAGGES